MFIEKLLDKTETKGVGFLKGLNQLTRGGILNIHIRNEINYGHNS